MADRFSSEIEKIENYENAKKDNFHGWNCHHRLETHNSDGEKRLVQLSPKELKALDMYYNRPADELIYLTVKDHTQVHSKGRPCSEAQKRKTSQSLMGHKVSEKTRKKISEKLIGTHLTEESKRKISMKLKGGNKTSFKKGHKFSQESINKQKMTSKITMNKKVGYYQLYKDLFDWNEFQTFYRLNKKRYFNK